MEGPTIKDFPLPAGPRSSSGMTANQIVRLADPIPEYPFKGGTDSMEYKNLTDRYRRMYGIPDAPPLEEINHAIHREMRDRIPGLSGYNYIRQDELPQTSPFSPEEIRQGIPKLWGYTL